jgi:hypothetical protein
MLDSIDRSTVPLVTGNVKRGRSCRNRQMAPIFPSMLGSRLSSLAAGSPPANPASSAERLKINIRSRASLGVRISRAARAKRGARGFSPGGETRRRTGETRETSAMPGLGAVPARGTVRRYARAAPDLRAEPPPAEARRFFLSTRRRERSRDAAERRRAPYARLRARLIPRSDALTPSPSLSPSPRARFARPADLRRARSHGREGFEWHERACFARRRHGPRRGGEAARARRARQR